MFVAIEYEIGVYIYEDVIQVGGTRIMDDGLEVNLRLCEAVVKERYSNTFIHILNQVGPFSHCMSAGTDQGRNVPTDDVLTRRRSSTGVVALEARSKTRRHDYRKSDSRQACSAAVPSILPEMGRCLWHHLCEKSRRHPRAELLSGQPEVRANCRGHLSGPLSSCKPCQSNGSRSLTSPGDIG